MKCLAVLTYWKKNRDGDFDEVDTAVGIEVPEDGAIEDGAIIFTGEASAHFKRFRKADYFGTRAEGAEDIGIVEYRKKDSNGDYDDIAIGVRIDQNSHEDHVSIHSANLILRTTHIPASQANEPARKLEVSDIMVKDDDYDRLPMAGFPMPEGWKGDSPENPNFKALGKLSAPIMRKIEPSGPAFIAYSRRKLKGRTFSEDDRIEALSKVKKIEDNDDGEISEPEDPMMLQRDAKDWKVRHTHTKFKSTH